MLGTLSVPLIGVADTAMIGHLPDVALLGAVATASFIFDLLFWSLGCSAYGHDIDRVALPRLRRSPVLHRDAVSRAAARPAAGGVDRPGSRFGSRSGFRARGREQRRSGMGAAILRDSRPRSSPRSLYRRHERLLSRPGLPSWRTELLCCSALRFSWLDIALTSRCRRGALPRRFVAAHLHP